MPELQHYGTPRHSGRYPYGSGENPHQRAGDFVSQVTKLRKEGVSDTDIVKALGLDSTTQLRARMSTAKNEIKKEHIAEAMRLRDQGLSNVQIGKELGKGESYIRSILEPSAIAKNDRLQTVATILRDNVDQKKYVDIGLGTESQLEISKEALNTAVTVLKDEGYQVHNLKVEQVGIPGQFTEVKVLVAPGVDFKEANEHRYDIRGVGDPMVPAHIQERQIKPPVSVDSKRLEVRYGPEGGSEMDGVIQLRRGVEDLDLGQSRYAQVRIAVDGTHYLKGMAVYSDDLPPGIDMRFNTNKSRTDNKLDALKKLKDDPESPFGAQIQRQIRYTDKHGKDQQSPLNIVNEEGAWADWSKTLSAQMLSKQSASLAKRQLGFAYDTRKQDYDDIMALDNPTVKKKLLQSFSDGCDSASVHMKAAAMPRQGTHVILPVPSMKPHEVFAPNYPDGTPVALIRFPHGGKFEIPELVVNNKNVEAKKTLGGARDAIGIHHSVAERLSGADFDGDTVLVIPNHEGRVKSSPPLTQLRNFDAKRQYKAVDGMRTIDGGIYDAKSGEVAYPRGKNKSGTGSEMGKITNLVTDMTIKGASKDEIARAVKHSMVVIDAEKHILDYRQSAIDNDIPSLKRKYQRGANSGASTLISLATSEARVPERRLRKASEGGHIDPATGKLIYVETGRDHPAPKKRDPDAREKYTSKVHKMALAEDANSLSSGTEMERVYADYANKLKALGNEARKSLYVTPPLKYSPDARRAYRAEVEQLDAALRMAYKNKPKERQAQLLANAMVAAQRADNPAMDKDELKKARNRALRTARMRMGAERSLIDITPRQWEAIQAGAISNNKLMNILDHADLEQIKAYATPRQRTTVTASKQARIKALSNAGYNQAEIAQHLGISSSTVNGVLAGKVETGE